MSVYLQLFLAFLRIGAFSFGGGYAAMPLIRAQIVEKYAWLSMTEFTDLVTIAEMTPGPIAVNSATFVGNLVGGIPGALVATAGVILPSCVFVTVLSKLYFKYRKMDLMQGVLQSLRPSVVAMILSAGLTILGSSIFPSGVDFSRFLQSIELRSLAIFVLGVVALRKFKMGPIKVILLSGAAELACQLLLSVA